MSYFSVFRGFQLPPVKIGTLQARTTHQPVILTHAPDRRITKQNETGTSVKI